MAEVRNEYFSSVFTTEDISSLPVPFTKFDGNTSEHLGQLFVTPEMILKRINIINWIPPKLLQEIVEQISTPLAKLFLIVTRRRNSSFRVESSKHYAAI